MHGAKTLPVLKNSRHEKFAETLAVGNVSARAAYIAAGYSKTGADQNASALMRNHKVAARIAELKAEAADRSSASADDVIREMIAVGFANIGDFLTVADGQPRLNLSKASHEQMAGLTAISFDSEGRVSSIRLGDKKGALVSLGSHFGLFKDRVRVEGKVELEAKVISELDAVRRINFLLRKAALAPPPGAEEDAS